jgi:hypothetical protein
MIWNPFRGGFERLGNKFGKRESESRAEALKAMRDSRIVAELRNAFPNPAATTVLFAISPPQVRKLGTPHAPADAKMRTWKSAFASVGVSTTRRRISSPTSGLVGSTNAASAARR